MSNKGDHQALQDEIDDLERRLEDAKRRLHILGAPSPPPTSVPHTLLLLSDSALPLGSFAFSSGLESYLAHHPQSRNLASFDHFLHLSLSSLASTALPYVLAGYRSPGILLTLDNDFDASLPCTVARRASITQGKALLGIWHRSFRGHVVTCQGVDHAAEAIAAMDVLRRSSSSTKGPNADDGGYVLSPSAHFPPLWGVVTRLMNLTLEQAAYVFLFNHVKAVVSAAVRANVIGPYQAQMILMDPRTQLALQTALDTNWDVPVEDAGQTAPVLDLWMGRHELLYSRIFNS
ncbi:MAG: hypothetical protein M1823_000332 [Watsoniomyces obsoletus]|nr:MAG: hypothetical protein M1823_000332 [Watsoniomyces obsoletus]